MPLFTYGVKDIIGDLVEECKSKRYRTENAADTIVKITEINSANTFARINISVSRVSKERVGQKIA